MAPPSRRGNPVNVIDRMSALRGTDFDRFYIAEESANERHQTNLCKREIANGVDRDFKSLASESLTRLQQRAGFLAELAPTTRSLPLQ